ncbi:iron chelate uptake ABC transporter family permease subunit [Isoptericola chiayiensis]|uniref:Iron chelate uptake ABC transporter family permease subunit n=1 Tax=Isoptericola chiayiensis TaxID=579446 RepID=A0ABP8YQN0_9MICO|nr:iron chelate uptake ABC transporter family permease subunit [Isoptericola chiayiensis]NOW01443.1 iron complex transport system permease protein [Isoptericola chiayiensis]
MSVDVHPLDAARGTSATPGAGDSTERALRRRARLVVAGLTVLALAATAVYLTVDVRAGWEFTLPFRGRRVAAMVVVGVAIATSTVVFQTLTTNRILTPSILGFDSLYQLLQTSLVFVLGSYALASVGVVEQFGVAVALMVAASLALFLGLFGGGRRSLHLVLLVGVVLGTLLRSATALMQRMMDPSEFQVLQSRLFASFTGVDERLLAASAVVVLVCCTLLWTMRRRLDVVALGRETAVALGVNHRRTSLLVLVVVAVLVSVSTALVGPITFFGLLVANLAYVLLGSHRHALTLPVAALLAVVTLVGGQALLEHLLGMETVLSVVIEFLGGIVFIALLVAGGRR